MGSVTQSKLFSARMDYRPEHSGTQSPQETITIFSVGQECIVVEQQDSQTNGFFQIDGTTSIQSINRDGDGWSVQTSTKDTH